MEFTFISYQVKERIAFITMNRPEKRNAFNVALVDELKIAFLEAEKDSNVRVVILGAKGEVFSAGADLSYIQGLQKNSYEENLADSNNLKELYQHIYTFSKIVIAQVEGHAIAGGAGLATVCDFTFCVPEAKFGYTEVKIGFIPAIVMVFLLRKISEGKAKEMLLTGDLISAKKAKKIGLVTNIYKADEISEKVKAFAWHLAASTSSQSISNTKLMMQKVPELSLHEAFNYAAEMNAKGRETADCKKGIEAFLNKEKMLW
jgi:methylglutaconyl-CoA hydratase